MNEVRDLPFRWLGGAIPLDFANTVAWERTDDRTADVPIAQFERLTGYERLVHWALEAGILTPQDAEVLLLQARERHDEANAVVVGAISLRANIHALVTASVEGAMPDHCALARLNTACVAAQSHRRIVSNVVGFRWEWSNDVRALQLPLWGIAHATGDLLTSQDLQKVRECDGDPCGFLFIDRSRNGQRRWCDMAHCGNRAKARRHYRRSVALRAF
ncbi:MAG: CGNR zinc finger domain-containing protein [Chloroflexota bacterium]